MKIFDKLSRDEYSKIVNERINSILEISNELLSQFIPIDTLRAYYIEHPPILGDKAHLKNCLLGTDGNKLGTLQRFYLMTYIVDGSILFRTKSDETCEMWIIFDRNPNWGQLNNDNTIFNIDGNNGLRGTNLLKIVSLNGLQFPLAPTLTLKIGNNGNIILKRPISTFISTLQPNSQVALLNLQVFDFNTLSIEIVNNDPDIKFDCNIIFI